MIARRHLLGLLGMVPFMGTPQRPDQSYDPPVSGLAPSSQSGVFIGRRVVVFSSGTSFQGVFVYSPAPGAGNLTASITSAAGTDPYGNSYQAGITSQTLSGSVFSQILNGSLIVSQSGTAWTVKAGNVSGIPYLLINTPVPHTLYISQAGNVIAPDPVSGNPETWHSMSPLAAGFTGGTPAPRYRLEPTGSGGVVRLAGQIGLTANHAAGNTFFTLPAAYVPSIVGQQNLPPSSNNLSGFSFNNGYVIVSPGTGTLDMGSAGSNGNVFWLDGLTYSLD